MSYKISEEGNITTIHLDGEIDMGLGSSIDSLCTILIDDPYFNTICYGGNLKEYDDRYEIFSLDGVRNKFHCRLKFQVLKIFDVEIYLRNVLFYPQLRDNILVQCSLFFHHTLGTILLNY